MKASSTMSRMPSVATAQAPGAGMATRGSRRIEYHVLYAMVFSMCLVVALLARLLPTSLKTRSLDRRHARSSLLEEARAGASSTVPYVFQL